MIEARALQACMSCRAGSWAAEPGRCHAAPPGQNQPDAEGWQLRADPPAAAGEVSGHWALHCADQQPNTDHCSPAGCRTGATQHQEIVDMHQDLCKGLIGSQAGHWGNEKHRVAGSYGMPAAESGITCCFGIQLWLTLGSS